MHVLQKLSRFPGNLGIAVLVSSTLFGTALAWGQALDGSVTEVKSGIANMPSLVSGFSYIAGGSALLSGAGMLKRHADNPQQNPLMMDTDSSPRGRAAHLIKMFGNILPAEGSELGVVPIFFATNRNSVEPRQKAERALAAFGTEQSEELKYGQAIVTIPTSNPSRRGMPRPAENRLLGYTVNRGAENANQHVVLNQCIMVDKYRLIAETTRLQRIYSLGTKDGRPKFSNQALIFVHGYNTSFNDALMRAGQIAFDIGFNGPVFVYSWPSRETEVLYRSDLDRAREGAAHLEELIETVQNLIGPSGTINILSHSMGIEPVLAALDHIARTNDRGRVNIGQVVAVAPDVSSNYFRQITRQILKIVTGVTLYVSDQDKAMDISKTLAGGDCRAGGFCGAGPIVMEGVDTIDTSDATDGFGHSNAFDRWTLLADISALLEKGVRPPDVRNEFLFSRVALSGKSNYFRYRN